MTYAEEEFFTAYDGLTKIITEEEFSNFEHKFTPSYHANYEYIDKTHCVFIKCNEENLLVEMVFYDLENKRVTDTYGFRFTLCKVYYEWLGHFTKLMFKEAIFCEQRYGIVRVEHDTERHISDSMHRLEAGDNPYQWQ